MKEPMSEAVKNYFKCAVMMLVVGLSLIALGKQTGGIICIVIAVAFAAIGYNMMVKDSKKENNNDKQ